MAAFAQSWIKLPANMQLSMIIFFRGRGWNILLNQEVSLSNRKQIRGIVSQVAGNDKQVPNFNYTAIRNVALFYRLSL